MEKTEQELNDLYGKVMDSEAEHRGTKWSGMSYEDGIKATIDWMQGNSDNDPMEG